MGDNVYLEKHVEDDIDEIEGVICQYTACQGSDLICKSEVLVGNGKLPNLSEADRVVYRRKE